MATYKGIQGISVQSLASDPSPTASVEGQLWYNSASNVWKISTAGAGAWSAGGDMSTGRETFAAAGVSATAGLAFGGTAPPSPTVMNSAETYNGTAWSPSPSMINPRRYFTGLGTQTAAIAAGGISTPGVINKTELYNGTAWSALPDLQRTAAPQRATRMAGFGISTSAIVAGGDESAAQVALCEQYNGTAWAEVADLLQPQSYAMGAGQSGTSGLEYGGYTNPPWANTGIANEWNGTSWSAVPSLNTARDSGCSSVYGTVTAAVLGGGRGGLALTEKYNGTSWTELADLTTPRFYAAGCGTATSALAIGGYAIPAKSATEEWSDPVYSVKTVTTS